ncbi:MAG TPA: hypothetical protein PLX59_03380 [Candidatus Cloacimonadota bacterium]|nr:hypothetical protein [Candidatus Cloacimonadota bacterium]
MNETLFKIRQIAAIVLFVLISSLVGLITGKPIMMVAYGAFFAVVTVAVLMLARKNQRHFEIKTTSNGLMLKVFGIALAILALAVPALIVSMSNLVPLKGNLNATQVLVAEGLNILFLILMIGSIFIMNKKPENKQIQIAGYIGMALASVVPGLTMTFIDRSTSGIGSAYYVALIVLVLAVNSYSLLVKNN